MSGDKHSNKKASQKGDKPKKIGTAEEEKVEAVSSKTVARTPSQAKDKKEAQEKPSPKPTSDKPHWWVRFVTSVKYYDGLLLLIALFLTVLISYHIDRGNRIENDARAVHAMLDSALETTLDFEVLGPLRADDQERIRKLSILRYRVAAGPYRIDPAESCIYTIMFQVDDFSIDTERESFLPNGDGIAASERIFERVKFLRKRIDEYSGYNKYYLWWSPSAKNLFGKDCFSPL